MKISKCLLGLIGSSIAGTALLFGKLPNQVPTHWNIAGQVDHYSGKASVFITALVPLALYLLMLYLPKLDPRKDSYFKNQKTYSTINAALVIFLILIHWATLLVALGYPLEMGNVVRALMGVLFLVLGSSLSQVRPNYFFGIRTPWTLANDEVWRKTHRVGGYGLMTVGITALISAFVSGSVAFIMFFGVLGATGLYVTIYSYWEYRKLNL